MTRRKLLIGLGILAVSMLLCCSLATLLTGNKGVTTTTAERPAAKITISDAATWTPPPARATRIPNTSTPEPTSAPPTSTPEPTLVPPATETPTLAVDNTTNAQYREGIQPILRDYTTALHALSGLTGLAADDIWLLTDDAWLHKMAETLATLLLCNDRVRGLQAPPLYEEAHGHLLDAADHMDLVVEYMIDGVDNWDEHSLSLALVELERSNDCLLLAVNAMPTLETE